MQIGKPTIVQTRGVAEYRVEVSSSNGDSLLWFRVDQEYGHLLSERADAALVGLLIPAMMRGENIVVDGSISESLSYSIRHGVQAVLRTIMPAAQFIEIDCPNIEQDRPGPGAVATGFSGGVDSYCALHDHLFGDVESSFRVTLLLFNNVGSHGAGAERLFKERYDRLRPLADQMGLPFVAVDSNLDSFYCSGKALNFEQTSTMRNAATALLLQAGISRFLYASAYHFRQIYVAPTSAIAHTDPVLLPLLSTRKTDLCSVGSEYTRVEKTMLVAEVPLAYHSLDVCVDPEGGGNCSRCWKCMRTMLTLESAGKLENFKSAFNIEEFRRHRSRYLVDVLSSRDPLMEEVREFMRIKGISIAVGLRLWSRLRVVLPWKVRTLLDRALSV